MFVYFSKKIAMPQDLKARSLAWNTQQGWLACGSDKGILKVLKLPDTANGRDIPQTAPSNLSMNQTLEGHKGAVLLVRWNQNYRKLTSSDENGLIIVWILHKSMWFEEMINNRSKSVVRDMLWSVDGQKICIVYEDGHVVVGNVDGHRLWGKDLGVRLSHVAWSPNGRLLLFCTREGKCLIYDARGNFVSQLTIYFPKKKLSLRVVGLDWYDGSEGHADPSAPTLAIGLETGEIQLMRNELDEDPVLIDCGMLATCIKWNPSGTVLAVVGYKESPDKDLTSMVQFYSHSGVHLQTLSVVGNKISDLAWEGRGLRIALAVESYIYLANLRPEYKWAFFSGSTCVYSFHKKDHEEPSVMFWDMNTDEKYCKYVKHLINICGAHECCILATMGEEHGKYVLILCNAIGSPMASKYIDVEPLFISMNSRYVFVASSDEVYCWNYQALLDLTLLVTEPKAPLDVEEQSFFVDNHMQPYAQKAKTDHTASVDRICCICSSEKNLMVGRESGIMHCYSLPTLSVEGRFLLECRPQVISLNCDSTRLSVIDLSGSFSFYDIHSTEEGLVGKHAIEFERKDVWSMKWADDNPDLIVIMEKTRMYILRGYEPEEPISCNAYLCNFHNLQIQAVHLDEVMQSPEQPAKEHSFVYETKSLRDTQHILNAVEIQDAYSFVEEHSHPRLWTSLAEYALQKLDLSVAEKAFVKCKDFYGIQFVKRLHGFADSNLQKAQVCFYFKRFEEAEQIYSELDRIDLAIDLRMKLGDWFVVEKLVESLSENDELLRVTWNNIGEFFADRQNWQDAVRYFEKAKNIERLADCFYALENWIGLQSLMENLTSGSSLLLSIAHMFLSVGLYEPAVTGFVRGGDISAAINCCLEFKRWDIAMALSTTHDCKDSFQKELLSFTDSLIENGSPMHAVEIYQNTGHHIHAVKVIKGIARKCAIKKEDPVKVKKLYVLAALESTYVETRRGFGESNVWHEAEAYHLWLLAHRALYNKDFLHAMKIAWWLRDYEDVLTVEEIYALIALTSFYNKYYTQCSEAFIMLESRSTVENAKETFTDLALSIFSKHGTVGPPTHTIGTCQGCGASIQELERKCVSSTCGIKYPICMASGTVIIDDHRIQCTRCKHFVIEERRKDLKHCPLCHEIFQISNC